MKVLDTNMSYEYEEPDYENWTEDDWENWEPGGMMSFAYQESLGMVVNALKAKYPDMESTC